MSVMYRFLREVKMILIEALHEITIINQGLNNRINFRFILGIIEKS